MSTRRLRNAAWHWRPTRNSFHPATLLGDALGRPPFYLQLKIANYLGCLTIHLYRVLKNSPTMIRIGSHY